MVCALFSSSDSTPPVPNECNVVDVFNQEMDKLKTSFPNQRPELWRRSLIHLRRHLKTERPTEPVSLILTSGHGAERTLDCLARCLAQAFSTARNSSVLNINGKSKASQDSDQVKLDIDSELRKAFDGKKFAAVIHRFEELPPGSTLIFYRYCDHENAAYKNVFLAFTVMLDAEVEVPSDVGLGRVEEMVQEHVKQKFVSSDKLATFNEMDVDKLSGLWSRISHLILPVAAEETIEQQGCWLWYMCKILLRSLILTGLLIALGFLGYKIFLWSNLPQTDRSHSETKEKFDLELAALETPFPSQRPVFWKRTGKHLKSHLGMVNPTEPVSVILTAGLQAERTLGCLARRLAMAYSTFRNASILEIDGTTKSTKDSDQVKLEIDEALKEAFEGDKLAAVVHRFEELPPGSTLIFYRYCDHENAAYKKVFLVFTVMLSANEIDPKASLSAVEDMVHDHIKQKFVSDISAKFNQMDVDKLSGLWSRISHVILPVAPEEKIEQQGCRD
ncbi:Torsin-1A-interacting protein 1 [Anabarilius grahami]|uniref:Torsin-1A-interacting protein 1 n=1 Tax=Anabarilius grahami TaxID=495550 RepID=A0A3N0XJT2_ANAGA|nr:Torsin-1A-interacting protein 1 [Anabarilius grahami]